MRPATRPGDRRQADNELYDRGCELVEAAVAIRVLAGHGGAVDAAPALLGCVEQAIRDLSLACVALEQATGESVGGGEPVGDRRWSRRVIERMHRGFENLSSALGDAERAAGASRALVARALAVAVDRRRP